MLGVLKHLSALVLYVDKEVCHASFMGETNSPKVLVWVVTS